MVLLRKNNRLTLPKVGLVRVFRCAGTSIPQLVKSNEKAVDYAGDFGFHSGFCWLFRAFSSDYMPLSLRNSAFCLFQNCQVDNDDLKHIWSTRHHISMFTGSIIFIKSD